jgi:hypothetical protein
MDRLNILIQVIAVSVEQLKQALNGLIMMSLELE